MGGQVVLGLMVLFVGVATLAYFLRAELTALCNGFVDRFGILGMAIGTFISDGFQVPLPPQLYMLAAITHQKSEPLALASMCAASVLAGVMGRQLAYRGAELSFLKRRLDKSRAAVSSLVERYGAWSFLILTVSPIPYSTVCYLIGLYRLPPKAIALFVTFRVPRILVTYLVIRLAWSR